jgi:hypothetical protein
MNENTLGSDAVESRRALTLAVRWVARTWGLASGLLLLAFAFGGHEHLRFTAREAMFFLLFPVGIIAGFVIAWWRELAGGLVTVGSYLLFCLSLLAWSGRWPGIYFFLFSAPGFVHIASFILARGNGERPPSCTKIRVDS